MICGKEFREFVFSPTDPSLQSPWLCVWSSEDMHTVSQTGTRIMAVSEWGSGDKFSGSKRKVKKGKYQWRRSRSTAGDSRQVPTENEMTMYMTMTILSFCHPFCPTTMDIRLRQREKTKNGIKEKAWRRQRMKTCTWQTTGSSIIIKSTLRSHDFQGNCNKTGPN